ncbi:serine/threonine-protein kinase [Thalassoroseus pseudoceratinae]|uniref:serine/threonine-protein kinase n=1 Tax=Thalassoroseus pseudoceratinae TaxID=2713176 RepID=UPI00141EF07E|nr:serine/threonine-protein kinase [Thalassoroseus pseudoceratinae]
MSSADSTPPETDWVARFLASVKSAGDIPNLEEFLRRFPEISTDAFVEVALADQSIRASASQPRNIDDYFQLLPGLDGEDRQKERLIAGDLQTRQSHGLANNLEDLRARFPELPEEFWVEVEAADVTVDQAAATVDVQVPVTGSFDAPTAPAPATDTDADATLPIDPPFRSNAKTQKDDDLTAPLSSAISLPETLADRHFGDYLLLNEIARGGMGVVYRAIQTKLNREVALKMILAGQFAGPDDVRRFHQEAKIAAHLDHPNIVPIYEVGEHGGQSYFSMGLVNGDSLSNVVRDQPLPPKEAAEICRVISEAVEYAHQRGVIHRDLKPANVLLDETGQPRITDFGLAKRTDAAGLDTTRTGQVIGTPGYMPPEQAMGQPNLIGAHSDVYSLGAILYCLVTGRPPFQAASLMQTLKQVVNDNPVPPRRLNSDVPIDLETVCLKCLSKEPDRRYASAQDFADDLQRFLSGVPVVARPVSRPQRVWRWCRRNPTVAGMGIALLIMLILGTAVSSYYAVTASRRAREAEQNFRRARAAVDEYFVRVSTDTLLNQPGMQPLQHELLRQALEYYREFLNDRHADSQLEDEFAETHYQVGLITEVIDGPEAAMSDLLIARDLQMALLKQSPNDVNRMQSLGATLTALGRVYFQNNNEELARDSYLEALEIRRQLAERTEAVESQRELANAYMNLAIIEQDSKSQNERVQAREHYEQAQRIREQALQRIDTSEQQRLKLERDLGKGWFNLAQVFDNAEAAREAYERAAEAFRKVIEAEPADQQNRFRLALCYRALGDDLVQQERFGAAIDEFKKASEEFFVLTVQNRQVDDYAQEYVVTQLTLGDLHRDVGDFRKASIAYDEALEVLLPLLSRSPSAPLMTAAAQTHHALGHVLSQLGQHSAAVDQFEKALSHWQQHEQTSQTIAPQHIWDRATLHHDTAKAFATLGEPSAVVENYIAAIQLLAKFPHTDADAMSIVYQQGMLCIDLCDAIQRSDTLGISLALQTRIEALDLLRQTITRIQPLTKDIPEFQAVYEELSALLLRIPERLPAKAEKPANF